MAAVALRGRAGLEEFTDAAALDPALQAFRKRVRIARDDSLDKMAARIECGGRVIEAPASRRMDDARIEAKLRELAGKRADDWLRFVARLESAEKVVIPA